MQPRPFSYAQQAIAGGIINAVINAAIGWGAVPAGKTLPLWGAPGIAFDLCATAFGIAFATVLIATPVTRKQIAQGKLTAAEMAPRFRAQLAGWPRSTFVRSINVGILSVIAFVPLPLCALALAGTQSLDRPTFTIVKTLFALVVGALATPVIAAAATVELRPSS